MSDKCEQGLKICKYVFSEIYVEKSISNSDEFSMPWW
jgi:hypothetical protein